MKSPAGLLVATVLAALCIAVSCAKAVDRALIMPNPSGTPAPESVHEWVRLLNLGGRNSLAPVIWVSPFEFKRTGIERLILLSHSNYHGFLRFVDRYRCSTQAGSLPVDGSIQIAQFSESSRFEVVCTMPPRKACEFFARSLQQRYFLSSDSAISDLRFLAKSVGC